MQLITHPVFLTHDTGNHPEHRGRLEVFNKVSTLDLNEPGEEYVHLIHDFDYVDQVKSMAVHGGRIDADTVVSTGSFNAAIGAVGAAIIAAKTSDFALVRPPGHHAYRNHGSGFCLFNNIAIASQWLKTQGKRVAIIDFDGHLGDGTSDIFYADPDILYWSLHQFPAFPGHGRPDEIGTGKGRGFTVNVPLPPGSGDDIFLHAFKNYLPVIEQFEPDVLAISAGFDAHRLDPLLQLDLSSTVFHEIGVLIREQGVHSFAVLEGGYNTEVLPACVYNFLAGINGQEIPYPDGNTTSYRQIWEQYDLDLHSGMSFLAPYWKF